MVLCGIMVVARHVGVYVRGLWRNDENCNGEGGLRWSFSRITKLDRPCTRHGLGCDAIDEKSSRLLKWLCAGCRARRPWEVDRCAFDCW